MDDTDGGAAMAEPTRPPAAVSLGPCVDCGAWSPHAVRIRAVASVSGPGRSLYACPEHAHRHTSRIRDLDLLARTRAEATGETVEEARAALTGGRERAR